MKKNKIVCPFCHVIQETDIVFEVIFNNFTIMFKCDSCKKGVRIYTKLTSYGELVKE